MNDFKYCDTRKERIIRKSAPIRILLGITSTTSVGFIFSLVCSRIRNYGMQYIYNWIKGSFVYSTFFFISNEAMTSLCAYYSLYTNFWINYTVLSFYLSKMHYRYLIRRRLMKWHLAIKYAHKCSLYFLTINLIIELFIFIMREALLYDEPDFLDEMKKINLDRITFEEYEDTFLIPFHIVNTPDKTNQIKRIAGNKNKRRSRPTTSSGLKTVNMYLVLKNDKRL